MRRSCGCAGSVQSCSGNSLAIVAIRWNGLSWRGGNRHKVNSLQRISVVYGSLDFIRTGLWVGILVILQLPIVRMCDIPGDISIEVLRGLYH